MTIVREIREVEGGWIVEARAPYGGSFPFGEVVCKTWDEVLRVLEKCSVRAHKP